MTKINVICVKWGDKYGPEFVNRLYHMVQRNLTLDHTFYCLTENSTGIIDSVSILPLDDTDLESYWHKLNVFKKDKFVGRCLYFDLDTVIQNNIDCLIHKKGILAGVYTYWNDMWTDENFPVPIHRHKTPFNSSVMTWQAEDYYWVWDKFQADKDWWIVKYGGDDKFIGNEVLPRMTFPFGWIYSRMYGMIEHGREGRVIVPLNIAEKQEVFYFPEALICMFNGPTTNAHYIGMEKYWL